MSCRYKSSRANAVHGKVVRKKSITQWFVVYSIEPEGKLTLWFDKKYMSKEKLLSFIKRNKKLLM